MHIVNFVHLDKVLKKHENYIAKQSGLSAKISILELLEYQRNQFFEVFVVFENLWSAKLSNVVWYFLHTFGKNVSLVGNV